MDRAWESCFAPAPRTSPPACLDSGNRRLQGVLAAQPLKAFRGSFCSSHFQPTMTPIQGFPDLFSAAKLDSERRRGATHSRNQATSRTEFMGIVWTIIIGFVAGLIAKFIMPGKNEPSGFIMTTILGVVGAFVATYLGQALGWYAPGEGAGLIGAIVGAIILLFVWGLFSRRRA